MRCTHPLRLPVQCRVAVSMSRGWGWGVRTLYGSQFNAEWRWVCHVCEVEVYAPSTAPSSMPSGGEYVTCVRLRCTHPLRLPVQCRVAVSRSHGWGWGVRTLYGSQFNAEWRWVGHVSQVNSSHSGQNGRQLTDDTLKCILLNENVCILINVSLKFVPNGIINNISVLVQIMVKQLAEIMMIISLTHICVTRLQWVKNAMPL